MKALAFILVLAPNLLSAQNLAERLSTAPDISFQEWQNMTIGKTVVYQIDGEVYGYERYVAPGEVTIRLVDGTCIDGTWRMRQSDFCFDWQDGPKNCFRHKRLDGAIYVIGLNNGVETDDIQLVSRIADISLSCSPALLSSLEVQP